MYCALHWVLQYWGRSNTHQLWFAIELRFGQKFFNVVPTQCRDSYLHPQYFNLSADRQVGQRFRAEEFQIPQYPKALPLYSDTPKLTIK
jgi:hypothetical protein